MAALVWFTAAIAIWHFTVFVPDRFWGGIVGAFIGSIAGGMATGAIAQVAAGRGIGETDMLTIAVALPGAVAGMGAMYVIGLRAEAAHRH
jgi:hypothetical protein